MAKLRMQCDANIEEIHSLLDAGFAARVVDTPPYMLGAGEVKCINLRVNLMTLNSSRGDMAVGYTTEGDYVYVWHVAPAGAGQFARCRKEVSELICEDIV